MNENGHFTLEAVIGVAIAAVLLAEAQQMLGTSALRSGRAKQVLEEARFLEEVHACFPRAVPVSRRDGGLNDIVRCPELVQGAQGEVHASVRTFSVTDPAQGERRAVVIRLLEFAE